MQKVNSIQAYKLVREGQAVAFQTDDYLKENSRLIKLAVNTQTDVALFATDMEEHFDDETGEFVEDIRLIAFVKAGFDQVEFSYIGNFKLRAIGGDVWLHTYDAGNFEVEKTDYESYARVFERDEEDPILAQIKYMARQNQRVLDAQMAADRAEREALYAEIRKLQEPANVTPPANPPAGAPAVAPAGSAAVGAPSNPPAVEPAAGGNGGEPNAIA